MRQLKMSCAHVLLLLCGLGAIGISFVRVFRPEELPRLEWDRRIEIRLAAALACLRLGSNSVQAVPALTAALCLNEEFPRSELARVQQISAFILGRIGPEAKAALPDLTRLLDSTVPDVRLEAIVAIWRITNDRDMVSLYLFRMLAETNRIGPCAAAAAVRRIGREAVLDPELIRKADLVPVEIGSVLGGLVSGDDNSASDGGKAIIPDPEASCDVELGRDW